MDIPTSVQSAYEAIKMSTPINTGNLRHNATKLESLGNGIYKIYIDETIAPYVPFTNEPWLSEFWAGKKNPNEGWWQRAVEKAVFRMAIELGGKVTKK